MTFLGGMLHGRETQRIVGPQGVKLRARQVLVTCHSDGMVHMLDAASGEVVAALLTEGGRPQARCAPGGKLVIQRDGGDVMCLDMRLASASPSVQVMPWAARRCVLWSTFPRGVQGRAKTAPFSLAVPARGSVVAAQERSRSTMHLFDLATGARRGQVRVVFPPPKRHR